MDDTTRSDRGPGGFRGRASSPWSLLRAETDRLFDQFATGFGMPLATRFGMPGGWPRLDLQETERAFVVTAELPGLAEQDVEITVDEGVLQIAGEKTTEASREEGTVHIAERSHGAFRRAVPLPPEADTEKVTAAFARGVLTVTIEKRADSQKRSRKVPITPGG